MTKKKKTVITTVDNTKVTITMNLDQAYTVMNAMEFYARMHVGQFDKIDMEFSMATDCTGKERDFWRDQNKRDHLRMLLNRARSIIFPELECVGVNGSHGIFSTQISPGSHNAWDIYQTVRHALAIHRDPNPTGFSTSYNTPMSISEKNPLPVVKITKED